MLWDEPIEPLALLAVLAHGMPFQAGIVAGAFPIDGVEEIHGALLTLLLEQSGEEEAAAIPLVLDELVVVHELLLLLVELKILLLVLVHHKAI